MYNNSPPQGKTPMSEGCAGIHRVDDNMEERNLRIVDSFSLPNFSINDKIPDPQNYSQHTITGNKKPAAVRTTFTLKKKKLDNLINNLFKVASEKVTQPGDLVKTEVEINDEEATKQNKSADNGSVISEELLKIENFLLGNRDEVKGENIESQTEEPDCIPDSNVVSLAQSLVEVKYSPYSCENVNLNVKTEKETCIIKEEKDTKPAERMFGWCSIEDLKNPLVQNMAVSSSNVNINEDLDVKHEDFQPQLVNTFC